MMVETIDFNGHKYRRYPDSENYVDKTYFQRGGGKGFLHRHVWEHYNGPIPDSCHVHHIDGDPGNNDISNLCLLTETKHLSDHGKKNMARKMQEDPAWLNHLSEIRPMTVEWHRSADGRAWHRAHASTSIQKRPVLNLICDNCGGEFSTQGNGRDRFCSNKCKSAYRRKTRADVIERECVICGAMFKTDKYKPCKTCSRTCGNESMKRSKRRSPDSDK